uniref:Uncharacterized protein n=1 Tax=Meloidogyne enterolobii TaxID=390850 RepID=A0A6V7UDM6_MELEN|nr:unnamed protein product [Meloidogyne enterolobii]
MILLFKIYVFKKKDLVLNGHYLSVFLFFFNYFLCFLFLRVWFGGSKLSHTKEKNDFRLALRFGIEYLKLFFIF